MIEVFALVSVGWLFSLCLHEFAHALVAYRGGDKSVRDKGYLTFNPLKYTQPVLSLFYPLLFLFLGGIGLPGGAVYIDTRRLKGRVWETAVALAGPLANMGVLVLLALPFVLARPDVNSASWFWQGTAFLFQVLICAVVLNLIPLPPLDGYGAVAPWLPRPLRDSLDGLRSFGWIALFAILWLVPQANHRFWDLIHTLSEMAGVPASLGGEGWKAYRFWKG
ncbi:MAG: site-2 protease family protein [Planctomycetota bacterium]|jgi:Zn-dependent protease